MSLSPLPKSPLSWFAVGADDCRGLDAAAAGRSAAGLGRATLGLIRPLQLAAASAAGAHLSALEDVIDF